MRSFIAKFAFVASALAFAGCAVPSGPDASESATEESQANLSKLAAKYVGTWNYDLSATDTVKFYNQLKLNADATYSATNGPLCQVAKPCPKYMTTIENGKWSVAANGRLTLKSDSGKKSVYTSSLSSDGFGMKLFSDAGHAYFTRLAHAGEHCGGNIATAVQCDADLVCFLGTHPDAGGTCMAPVAEGGSCGFRTQTAPCVEGLECRHVSGPLDALTCAKPATSEGKFCGGIAGIACPDGYSCKLDGTYPDAGGTCQSIEGQFCGGIAAFACPAGYDCVLDGTYPDAGGSCHKPTSTGKFCGGIAAIACPDGYQCVLDGTYPDAGGSCQPL